MKQIDENGLQPNACSQDVFLQKFHSMHFQNIQALRGILALFVVLEHIRFAACGAFGVDVFFAISGFMILFSTAENTKHFFTKRLIRILPLYYLMTLATFLLLLITPDMFETTSADIASLVKSLLFIPFDIGGGVLQPLMRVGWTINCEIFFYFLFWISFKISHKCRALICSGLILMLVVLSHTLPHNNAFLAFYGAPVMLDFIWGMLAYYVCRWLFLEWNKKQAIIGTNTTKYLSLLSVITTLVVFVLLIVTKADINSLSWQRPLYWGGAGFLLVLAFFVCELCGYIASYPTIQLGNASFSLYLLHYYPVMLLDRMMFHFDRLTLFTMLGVCIAITASVILALLSHEWIEKRLSKWLKNMLIKTF